MPGLELSNEQLLIGLLILIILWLMYKQNKDERFSDYDKRLAESLLGIYKFSQNMFVKPMNVTTFQQKMNELIHSQFNSDNLFIQSNGPFLIDLGTDINNELQLSDIELNQLRAAIYEYTNNGGVLDIGMSTTIQNNRNTSNVSPSIMPSKTQRTQKISRQTQRNIGNANTRERPKVGRVLV
jgi:hypothetical protein